MKFLLPITILSFFTLTFQVHAKTPQTHDAREFSSAQFRAAIFYEVLLGEIHLINDSDPTMGYSLLLDAAHKTKNTELFKRAVDVALEFRSGDAALSAAQAWQKAYPTSREANRYILQILVALNRLEDSLEPLKKELALTPDSTKPVTLMEIVPIYARATNLESATAVVREALTEILNNPTTGASAWVAIGRLELAANNRSAALEAAQNAYALASGSEDATFLALGLMEPDTPVAELWVKEFLHKYDSPEVRMAYAQTLIKAQRYQDATAQLQRITKASVKPPNDTPEIRTHINLAWLLLGTLQLENKQYELAQNSIQKFIDLSADPASTNVSANVNAPVDTIDSTAAPESFDANGVQTRLQVQAYLAMAQIAEQKKDYITAEKWLTRVTDPEHTVRIQIRRASLLAAQNKFPEALQILHDLPEDNAEEARQKLAIEIQFLRDNQKDEAAYDRLKQALTQNPKDPDLLYDFAMQAEIVGKPLEMEQTLSTLLSYQSDHFHAKNALGYAWAQRGVKLEQAKVLIQEALQAQPDSPHIRDSLGWVEFKLGHIATALDLLETTFKDLPDAEVAAHLGEVLWHADQPKRAQEIWTQGLKINPKNKILLETIQRLNPKP